MPATTRKPKRTRTSVKASRRVLPVDRARTGAPVGRILLNGRRLDMQIGDRLTGARLERTTEGANTLTLEVWNGDRAVTISNIFGKRAMENVLVELDGLGYYVAGVSKSGDQLTVTCEDAVILKAKRHGKTKPLRASRDTTTRAAFCARMLRAASVPVVVLDEYVVQKIAAADNGLATAVATAKRDDSDTTTPVAGRASVKGVTGDITIGGSAPNSDQRRNIAIALGEASSLKAGTKATLSLVEACLVEPGTTLKGGFTNPTVAVDHDSVGILQARLMYVPFAQATDVAYCCRRFLSGPAFTGGADGAIALERKNPSWSAGQIAQKIQGSAFPDRYDTTQAEAEKIVAAGGGSTAADGSSDGVATTTEYVFERQKGESSYTAARRLLDEVRWRLFVREGVFIIASDTALMRARPSLTLRERSAAVETLDFEWHRALRVSAMTGRAYVGRYQADPGETIDIDGLDATERKWLLSTVSQELLTDQPIADIGLRQPQAPAPEPAAELASDGAAADGGTSTAAALFAACKAISDQKLPYVWGGGHAKACTPDGGTGRDPGVGYDCSGSTCAALAAAGLGYTVGGPVDTSGTMAASYGKPGQGTSATVWASSEHVFIRFTGGDMEGYEFNTAGHPADRGPRLLKQTYGTNGFTARHPDGL